MKSLIRKILREDDLDWMRDASERIYYRFFDVSVCWSGQYDESAGEDDCLEGGSVFLKIPLEEVEEIWDYTLEDDYMAGPGDEGADVIRWGQDHDYDLFDVFMFDYVREISEKEFCMAVVELLGGQSKKHSDVCGENNEIGKGVWSESIEDSDWDFIKDITNTFNPMTQIMFNPPLNLRVEDDLLKTLLVDLSDSNYWKWNGGGSLLDYGWIDRYSRIDPNNVTRPLLYSINLGAMGDVTRTTGGHHPKPRYTQINGREMYS